MVLKKIINRNNQKQNLLDLPERRVLLFIGGETLKS
jgi:hypothetical protein